MWYAFWGLEQGSKQWQCCLNQNSLPCGWKLALGILSLAPKERQSNTLGLKAISQAWGRSQVPCYSVKPSGWSWSLSLQPQVRLTISDLGILVSWKKKWNEGGLKQNLLKLFLSYYAWRKVVKKNSLFRLRSPSIQPVRRAMITDCSYLWWTGFSSLISAQKVLPQNVSVPVAYPWHTCDKHYLVLTVKL